MLGKLFGRSGGATGEITFNDLRAQLEQGACVLVDVREPHEFAAGRPHGASNMPLSRFDPAALPTHKPVVLICQAGGRSARALAAARAAGRSDVVHYPGGFGGWRSLGGPVA
jgi:rhodanese-related sulfurtransferase